MFMFAAPTAADLAALPDLPVRPALVADMRSRSARLLGVIRKLIDYGKELAGTLRRNGADTITALTFGTTELALILQRITLGLHRAAELEARVIKSAACLDRPPVPYRVASPGSTPPKPAPQPDPVAEPTEDANPVLARLPTPEAIAAEVRRRPIGAVLEDICRDLGILPTHPLWYELLDAILDHHGDPVRVISHSFEPPPSRPAAPPRDKAQPPSPAAAPPCAMAPSTHPP